MIDLIRVSCAPSSKNISPESEKYKQNDNITVIINMIMIISDIIILFLMIYYYLEEVISQWFT